MGAGDFLLTWGQQGAGADEFSDILSLALSPGGRTVYVGDNEHGIQVFDAEGNLRRQLGDAEISETPVSYPTAIAVDADGFLYVIDGLENALLILGGDGTAVGHLGSAEGEIGNGPGEFWHPSDVVVSPDGAAVYVADTNNQRIQAFAIPPCAVE